MKRMALGLIVVVFLTSGCTSSISYKFDKTLYKRKKPLNYSVVVGVFDDARPEEEHSGKLEGKKGYATTSDKLFKPDVARQVSEMLAKHLREANIFRKVKVESIGSNLLRNPSAMQKLYKKGFRLAIVADLQHFYGYQSGETSRVASSVLFGMIGAITEAIVNPKIVGARVEYSDIEVIDLKSQKAIWRGNLCESFEESDTIYDGPVYYVLQTLKKINDRFAKRFQQK